MDVLSVLSVVVTGISIVAVILLLLMFIIMGVGKIFTSIEKKKSQPKKTVVSAAPEAPVAKATTPAPVVEDGITDEVVAAISAAIAVVTEGKAVPVSIKRAVSSARQGGGRRRSEWGQAGIRENTMQF